MNTSPGTDPNGRGRRGSNDRRRSRGSRTEFYDPCIESTEVGGGDPGLARVFHSGGSWAPPRPPGEHRGER
jgi:hypothetical protein